MSNPSAPAAPRPDFRPKCRRHEEPLDMTDAVLKVHYPLGTLPVRGYRCPSGDGEERILGGDLQEANDLARKLGLYAPERVGARKFIQVGNSTAVTIPSEILAAVLGPGSHVGEPVEVAQVGDTIVVRPKPEAVPSQRSSRKDQ